MRFKKELLFLIAAAGFCFPATGQTSTANGWVFSNHKQSLSKRWSLLSDVQVRSANHFNYIETVLLRPGIQYSISKQKSVAVGYAWLGNWKREAGETAFSHEHRVWEQMVVEARAGNADITNRLRLEQRFLQQDENYDFTQRLRHYIRIQKPLSKSSEFTKGIYAALQNELFLNVQNKDKVNRNFFDQNRTFAAVGYRFSKAMDVEGGYLFRYQIEEEKMRNHIFQLVFITTL